MKLKIIVLLFSLCTPFSLLAETEKQKIEKISQFDNDYLIRVSFLGGINNFNISYMGETEQTAEDMKYSSNADLFISFDLYYKQLGISFSLPTNSADEYEDLRGKTKAFDFQMYFYTRKWGVELFFQRYKGFYLENSETFGLEETDSEVKRPDIQNNNYGINYIYVFSDNFSFNAMFSQMERQNIWDWSILMLANINYFEIKADDSLIISSEQSKYGQDANYSGGKYLSSGVAPGIGIITPFWGKFYVGGALFGGVGIMYQDYDNLEGPQQKFNFNVLVNLKISLGYNGDTMTYGLVGSVDSRNTAGGEKSTIDIQNFSGFVELFLGVRF